MTVQFDNDIPPPTRRTGPKGLYNFGEMAVGQSFRIAIEFDYALQTEDERLEVARKKAVSLRVCAYQWAKRAKSTAKFTVAVRYEDALGTESEDGLPVVRVWRIA